MRMFPVMVMGLLLVGQLAAAERLNLLVITTDDMSADSVGAFDCKLAGTTPNMLLGPSYHFGRNSSVICRLISFGSLGNSPRSTKDRPSVASALSSNLPSVENTGISLS